MIDEVDGETDAAGVSVLINLPHETGEGGPVTLDVVAHKNTTFTDADDRLRPHRHVGRVAARGPGRRRRADRRVHRRRAAGRQLDRVPTGGRATDRRGGRGGRDAGGEARGDAAADRHHRGQRRHQPGFAGRGRRARGSVGGTRRPRAAAAPGCGPGGAAPSPLSGGRSLGRPGRRVPCQPGWRYDRRDPVPCRSRRRIGEVDLRADAGRSCNPVGRTDGQVARWSGRQCGWRDAIRRLIALTIRSDTKT